jgi:hypothetical protein
MIKLLFCTLVFIGAQPYDVESQSIINIERKIKKVRSQLINKYKVIVPKKVKIHLIRTPYQKIKLSWLKSLKKQGLLIGGFKGKKEAKWEDVRIGRYGYIPFTYIRKIYWIQPTKNGGYNGLSSRRRIFIPTFKLTLDQIENIYTHERVHSFGLLDHDSKKFKDIEYLINTTCL